MKWRNNVKICNNEAWNEEMTNEIIIMICNEDNNVIMKEIIMKK